MQRQGAVMLTMLLIGPLRSYTLSHRQLSRKPSAPIPCSSLHGDTSWLLYKKVLSLRIPSGTEWHLRKHGRPYWVKCLRHLEQLSLPTVNLLLYFNDGVHLTVIHTVGLLEANALTPTRLVLSVPIVNVHTHPLVVGPVFASHPLDLQSFPVASHEEKGPTAVLANVAHVGPPSVNVEVKLTALDDAAVEAGASPMGEVCHVFFLKFLFST